MAANVWVCIFVPSTLSKRCVSIKPFLKHNITPMVRQRVGNELWKSAIQLLLIAGNRESSLHYSRV